ncbi:MAG: histidine kinase [Lewinellaceae bacterium]|nr:histidine kinase [Lewinellaceae bacterium]
MKIWGTQISSDRLLRWLILTVFWGVWLGMPFLSQDDDERHRQFMWKIFPVTLMNIPLFFLNTELLIPKILRKRGIGPYLISLLGLILLFVVIESLMKNSLLSCYNINFTTHVGKSLFYVLFITAISTGYGLMTHLVREEQSRQMERQERLQSELSFLRSQISPHFIFNILNSIVYLIRSRSDLAEPVTIKLSELMRYMLYESADALIPLEKELGYLKNYVELQKIRFEEDVLVRMDIEGTVGGQIIEPMLMIPFVENAFKHGVGLVADPTIEIYLKISDKNLHFRVRNKIAPGSAEVKDNSSGIGLKNVQRRLELLYPESHRLELTRTEEWFKAELWLEFGERV